MSTLDDAVVRLKTSVPQLIAKVTGTTGDETAEDAATVELLTLADQVDAALGGTAPAAQPSTERADPGAPAV